VIDSFICSWKINILIWFHLKAEHQMKM
jgi:hypothetical protein